MRPPTAVMFHGMAPSEWIEADVRTHANKLEKYCPDIISCHVAVDLPHRHHEEGNRFSVRIDLVVPGARLAVTRGSNLHASRQDLGQDCWIKQFDVEGMRKQLRLVIKEAFDVARRRLQDHVRRRRLAVKRHEEPARPRAWLCGLLSPLLRFSRRPGGSVLTHVVAPVLAVPRSA